MSEIERFKIKPMQGVAVVLQELARQWVGIGKIVEVEWSRIRALEFQDAFRAREAYVKRSSGKACLLCERFQEHVRVLVLLLSLSLTLFPSSAHAVRRLAR